MFWNLTKYIKKIHGKTFPDNPIPIKIVLKRPGWAPATYMTDTKDRTKKPNKEWYEVAILTRFWRRNDEEVGNHETRHCWQRHHPELSLLTKDKLIQMLETKSNETKQRIKNVLRYVNKLYDQIKEDPWEVDAIIIERLIAESPDSIRAAPLWIKQGADRIF